MLGNAGVIDGVLFCQISSSIFFVQNDEGASSLPFVYFENCQLCLARRIACPPLSNGKLCIAATRTPSVLSSILCHRYFIGRRTLRQGEESRTTIEKVRGQKPCATGVPVAKIDVAV